MATRDDIVAAAGHIMSERGYAHATTKEIAREAGYSEATLYKHFADKTEIFLAVLSERSPGLVPTLAGLHEHGPSRDVRDNLADVAAAALGFYAENFPVAMSLFSATELLAAHRARLAELGGPGPRFPLEELARYVAAEQRRGRIRGDVAADSVAALLLGACFQQAFLTVFEGGTRDASQRRHDGQRLADTVLAGLTPGTMSPGRA
ncbi:TetR/AcrR family transcriptional regulator [Saccharomonospora piscinae]|uniref:TetR/AcrR family transcriptional regulator n=1 Tax=Saccharomonospora piscinae TaxID=687388 RepID=UPI000463E5B6|nr:TetR/AcrR family transcriptional regulator [Saccharomonospora piscinae]